MHATLYMNEQLRRRCFTPFWVRSPLLWRDTVTGYGIGQFALDGNVGMFNLAWLMVNTDSPPPARVYAQRDLPWLILHAEHLCPGDSKHTLLEMASLLTLPDFTDALTMTGPHIVQVSALLHNARKKLQSDEHHLRR